MGFQVVPLLRIPLYTRKPRAGPALHTHTLPLPCPVCTRQFCTALRARMMLNQDSAVCAPLFFRPLLLFLHEDRKVRKVELVQTLS